MKSNAVYLIHRPFPSYSIGMALTFPAVLSFDLMESCLAISRKSYMRENIVPGPPDARVQIPILPLKVSFGYVNYNDLHKVTPDSS